MDRKVQMMDAGMRLFETEKPFGTVLGGIKTEMAGYGKVYRRSEAGSMELPPAAEDCDLFLDHSSWHKSKYISCSLEDAGIVGKTADGEEIHRYAASLKEGNRNTAAGISAALTLAVSWILIGVLVVPGGGAWTVVIFTLLGAFCSYRALRPDKDSTRLVEQLLQTFEDAK